MKSLSLYTQYSLKNFFFDKYRFINNYQMPNINKLYIHIFFNNSTYSRESIYKSLVWLYSVTGVKPLVCIKKLKIKGRGLKKKKITNIFLLLTGASMFSMLFFIISRQIPLIKFFSFFQLKNKFFSITTVIPVSDDDFLLQALHVTRAFKVQLSFSLQQHSLVDLKQFKTFLIG